MKCHEILCPIYLIYGIKYEMPYSNDNFLLHAMISRFSYHGMIRKPCETPAWHSRANIREILVPQSSGYPNSWMIYKGKSQCKMHDLGVPLFQDTSKCPIYKRGYHLPIGQVLSRSHPAEALKDPRMPKKWL